MGQALYRKYRSKSLDEIVGQEHITETLRQAIKSGRISHAYLFTGPHGVGKTSIARILAHEVNGLPYTDDSSHIDIIEIDAASNRRIDEIRELREKVYVAPTSATYKVYIIDEVHMLTREAFNALLKTLEEPPAHVIFILATTDAHKLPETIISRTQRFTFKPVEQEKVVAHLKQIAKSEHLNVTDEALELLAKHGEGSFRDSISLLDQAASNGAQLDAAGVLALLGIPPEAALQDIVRMLAADGTPAGLFENLETLYGQGYQAAAIAKQLGQLLRAQLISDHLTLSRPQTLSLLRQLIEVPASGDPERLLEIVLLENGRFAASTVSDTPAPAPKRPSLEVLDAPEPAKPVAKAAVQPKSPEQTATVSETVTPVPEPIAETSKPTSGAAAIDPELWPQILAALKKKHNTLYGVARMAQPEFDADGSTLRLRFSFPFHQKRISEAKNRQLLSAVIQEVTGRQLTIECLVDKSATPYQAPAVAPPKPPTAVAESPSADLVTISNIFGGGELLES